VASVNPSPPSPAPSAVLQEALEHDVPHMVLSSPRDHSHNGVKDHFDVWIQRTGSLLDALAPEPRER